MAGLISVEKGISPYNNSAVCVYAFFDGRPTKDDLLEAAKECTGSMYVGEDCPEAIAEDAEYIEDDRSGLECWFLGHAC